MSILTVTKLYYYKNENGTLGNECNNLHNDNVTKGFIRQTGT